MNDPENNNGIDNEEMGEESPDNHEIKEQMDRREFLYRGGAVGASLLCLALGIRKSCSESSENLALVYLGKWKGVLAGDHIAIRQLSTDNPEQPLEKIDVGKEEAFLLLPINTPNMPFGRIGGIYKMDDKHLFVLWCDTCKNNVVMGIRKTEDGCEVGIPDTLPNSIAMEMCMIHDERHRKYDPSKWLKYKFISK